ncbi:MAG TPA: flavin reductase family protein [Pseudogracilibacillus sp.]|nr:flavin reductase family protein [Pseudogracilibacillus sp.]
MDFRKFRQAMGTFATGVTVITTEVTGKVHGMTANAFMSVSLDPKLVLVSIDKNAQMLDKIREVGKYAVNVLANDQQEYAMIFAGQTKGDKKVTFGRLNDHPVLKEALLKVTCDVDAIHEAGDHILFVGAVTDFTMENGEPLLFYGGKYRTLNRAESLSV